MVGVALHRTTIRIWRPLNKAMFSSKTLLASKRHLIWLLATGRLIARLVEARIQRSSPKPLATFEGTEKLDDMGAVRFNDVLKACFSQYLHADVDE